MADRVKRSNADLAVEQAELDRIEGRLAALQSELEEAAASDTPRIWTSRTPNPNPRAGATVVALGDRVYVVGGLLQRKPTDLVDEYDPATDTWTARHPISTSRFEAYGAAVGGKLYVFGGRGETAMEIYDPRTDSWQPGTDMPGARINSTVAVADGRVFVIGGDQYLERGGVVVGEKSYKQNIEVYDPQTRSWEESLPGAIVPLISPLAHTVEERIYILGGNPMFSGAPSWTVIAHDPATGQEQRLRDFPEPPESAVACAHGDRTYLVGKVVAGEKVGGTRLRYRGVTQEFHPSKDRWEAKTPMPSEASTATCASAGGKIYVGLGGKALLEYDPSADL